MKVSIVIPAYNEEATIGEVLDVVLSTMKNENCDYEVIVVDDGSRDNTPQIALERDGVKLVQHVRNKGVGAARTTGIRNAQGEIVTMIDGDGTYPAEDIPKLLKHMDRYDMVVGARVREAGSLPLLRGPMKFFIRKLAEYITRSKIDDLNSGLRAFRKDIATQFLNVLPEGHSWVSTLTIAFLSNGYDIKYPPIEYHRRRGKSTFHPIADTFAYFLLVFRTAMYFKPLKIFFPLAAVVFITGAVRTVYDAKVLHDIKESDVIIVLTSIILGTMGLLADLIVKQHKP